VKTVNGGTTWTLANTGLTGNDFYTIFALDANICWVGAGDGGLWKTTNGGANWTFVTLTPACPFINVVHFFNANEGFVQGDPAGGMWGYYITTNGGTTWTAGANRPASSGTEAGWNNSYCAIDTGHIWWGTNVGKIWKGSFRGPFTSGVTTGHTNSYGVAFKDANNGISCFSAGSIMTSNNGGTSWTAGAFTPTGTPYGLKSVGGWYWMSTGLNIYRSTNDGTSWVSQQALTSTTQGYCISMYSVNRGWVGTQGGLIYRYTDVVGIGNNQNQTPTQFTLEQNYPNPFNPTTHIGFNLVNTGFVTLKVYDMTGKEVVTLVNEVLSAGKHDVIFNAEKLSSGTYFYTMQSGEFNETKTMMLIK
jgi:hypothetical protein